MTSPLASWRPGPTRDAIVSFLDRLDDVPVDERVAYVDNDGTMWCEKPTYVQFDFFVDALAQRVADDPSLGERPEFAAVLTGDMAAIGEIGLGQGRRRARPRCSTGRRPTSSPPRSTTSSAATGTARSAPASTGVIYQPMLELLDELRARDFTIGIVTGGGTEFVRQVSKRCYGVEPGMVVGTLIGYAFDRDDDGRPVVRRTITQIGTANEGGAKVEHIQAQIGRPPHPRRSATPAATARCSSGPRPAATAASRSSSTTTTPSASSPTRAPPPRSQEDEPITTVGRTPRLGRREHAGRLGDRLRRPLSRVAVPLLSRRYQALRPLMPLPTSLAPRTTNRTIMMTALWSDMNSFIDVRGPARCPARARRTARVRPR